MIFMFVNSFFKITRNTSVHNIIVFIRHYINVIVFHKIINRTTAPAAAADQIPSYHRLRL